MDILSGKITKLHVLSGCDSAVPFLNLFTKKIVIIILLIGPACAQQQKWLPPLRFLIILLVRCLLLLRRSSAGGHGVHGSNSLSRSCKLLHGIMHTSANALSRTSLYFSSSLALIQQCVRMRLKRAGRKGMCELLDV